MMGTMRLTKILDKNRILVVQDSIRLASGQSFKIKDYRGFTVAEIDQTGNLKIKGTVKKI